MIDPRLTKALENMISEERKTRFKQVISQRSYHFTIAVEDVFQSHNSSAIIRSCEVFGVQQAHFIEKRNTMDVNEGVALGAQKWVNIQRHKKIEQCVKLLKAKGYRIVATTPHRQGLTLENFDISTPAVFLFGTEKKGLSEEALSQADTFLTIPMVGFTESLNISVATGVILQSLYSRLRNSDISWKLTSHQQRDVYYNWLLQSIKNSESVVRRFNDGLF